MTRMLLQIMQDGRKSVGKSPQSAISASNAAIKGISVSARFSGETPTVFEDQAKHSTLAQ